MRKASVVAVLVLLLAGCNTIPRTIRGTGALARDIGEGLYLDGNACVTAMGALPLFRRGEKEVTDGE